jgi:hypothetical protein
MPCSQTAHQLLATAPLLLLPEFRSAEPPPDSAFHSETASPPKFGSAGLAIDSTFDFLGDFNWNSDVSTYSSNFEGADIGGLFVQNVPNGVLSTVDPTLFGLATDNCTAVIPSNFDTPAVDPLHNFLASDGFMGSSTDFGAIIDPSFASAGPSDSPMLPLPPPESPPAASPAVGQSLEPKPGPSSPRLRRSREEVDLRNILHTTRVQAPRKRFAEYEDVSGRPHKKKQEFFTARECEKVAKNNE